MSSGCAFLEPHLTLQHSNLGVHSKHQVTGIGLQYILKGDGGKQFRIFDFYSD